VQLERGEGEGEKREREREREKPLNESDEHIRVNDLFSAGERTPERTRWRNFWSHLGLGIYPVLKVIAHSALHRVLRRVLI
jgi:hypothetical protein